MKQTGTCPFELATWISKITFWWMNPLFTTGRRKCITVDDIYDVVSTDRASLVESRLERTWNEELAKAREKKRHPSLFKAILLTFRIECLLNGIYIFISEGIGILRPYLLGKLLGYFEPGSGMSPTEVYVTASVLAISELTRLMTNTWYIFRSQCIDMRMKAAVSCLVYRKILKVSSLSLQRTTSGKIVNHLSSDVETLHRAAEIVHYIWIAPLVLVINMYLIYQSIGIASLFMLPLFVALVPFEGLFGRLFGHLRMKIGARTDKRIYVMNEIFIGMKVVKMYCWEKPFSRVISRLRRAEMKQIWFTSILKCVNISVFMSSSRILCMAVYVAAWKLNIPLTSSIIFSVKGWIESIMFLVFFCIGLLVERSFQMFASMKRIQSFLEEQEVQNHYNGNGNLQYTVDPHSDYAIDVCKMTATWTNLNQIKHEYDDNKGENNLGMEKEGEEESFSLRDIDLTIKKGELIAVVGAVGSGKTSLLMTLLGELPATNGHITVNGSIGYVSQQPWVVSGTVRKNILLGKQSEPEKYLNVIHVCALEKDIEQMLHRDMTLVGERGLLLSGGQKARLSLARAINMDCDIYLLDDPFGAVDTEVGKHIFNKCVCEYLKGRTRILVTHQLQYLKAADRIIVFKEGRIADVGKYAELENTNAEFSTIIRDDLKEKEDERNDRYIMKSKANAKTEEPKEAEQNEDTQRDTVDWKVYRDYIAASGYHLVVIPLLLVLIILTQGFMVIGDWFLARWGDMQDALHSGGMLQPNSSSNLQSTICYGNKTECEPMNITGLLLQRPKKTLQNLSSISDFSNMSKGEEYMYIYMASVIMYIIVAVLFGLVLFTTLNISAKHLHDKMFEKVINAKTRLFDSKPVGQILNRFARDLGLIDGVIPFQTYLVLESGSRAIAILIVTCVINPLLLVSVCPVVIVIVFLRRHATKTIRHLKRTEAVTRSPMFSHVSDTLHGLQTIRALNKSDDVIEEFDTYQDRHTIASFLYIASFRWFSVRSMFAVGCYSVFVIFISLILKDVFGISGGLYGLSLSYVLMLATPLELMMRQSAKLESDITSVERIMDYTRLEQETEKSSDHPPPPSWPSEGHITFKDLCLKYFESCPFILKDINCTIKEKEKVGIVGRTGAGKSSIVAALLRLAEPTGTITIDTVNIQKIGLHELRAKISVIPQDPILFGGTLRYNLDPFDDFKDDTLWDSLHQVQLKTKVESMAGQLYAEMSEGGKNFSVGQRQLVCLARAVLHNNKILILDEATANVDEETEKVIQRTIREIFKDCTVLTIAHRLHTIMDSDRVMVLDNGILKEFDVPYKLLRYKNGYFRKLVDQTGHAQVPLLHTLAEKSYKNMLIETNHS